MEEPVLNADLIGIFDQTLACLVTWLEGLSNYILAYQIKNFVFPFLIFDPGHSLAQTVFTNLYLHAPFQVTHPFLKAMSVSCLKLVDMVKEFVSRG